MKKPNFINAQQMHRKHPQTFYAPSPQELNALKVGDSVKVCTADERFWVTLTQIGQTLTGTVDNDLVNTNIHGLKLGDTVQFNREHIYNIYED